MSGTGEWLRRAALGMLLAVLVLAGLTAKVVVEGEAALAKSDAAFDRGDLRESVLYARRAALLYAPGAPHVGAAYARLGAIAVGAEATGQGEVARQAWGAVRGAALETRHLWTPRGADLARANANLARLASGAGSASPERERMARILARDDAPRAGWVLVLGAGFGSFAAGLALALGALGGVSAEGRPPARKLLLSVALALVGVACWTLAVFRA
jgi:hypothetical protein